jgi:hypothetical protein
MIEENNILTRRVAALEETIKAQDEQAWLPWLKKGNVGSRRSRQSVSQIFPNLLSTLLLEENSYGWA